MARFWPKPLFYLLSVGKWFLWSKSSFWPTPKNSKRILFFWKKIFRFSKKKSYRPFVMTHFHQKSYFGQNRSPYNAHKNHTGNLRTKQKILVELNELTNIPSVLEFWKFWKKLEKNIDFLRNFRKSW